MIRRLFVWLTALLLAIGACAEASIAPEEALLEQVGALMDVQEQIDAQRDALYRAVEDYLSQGDYPSLVRARLACSDARVALVGLSAPEVTLEDDALKSLIDMGVETVLVEDKAREIRQTLSSEPADVNMLEAFLYRGVLWEDELEDCGKWAALLRDDLALQCEFDCLCLNALLAPLKDSPAVARFWEDMPERWPLTGRYAAWIDDEAALNERGAQVLDAMAELHSEASRYVGLGTHHVDQNAGSEPTHAVPGMPACVPLPDFWDGAEERALHASDALGENGLPETLIWRIAGVSEAAFLQYVSDLEAVGFARYRPPEERSDGWKAYLVWSDAPVILTWSADGVMLIACDPADLSFERMAYH